MRTRLAVLAVFVGLSTLPSPTIAETVAPPRPVRQPAPIPLGPEIVLRLESTTASFVYHIKSAVSPECKPEVGASEERILCFGVKDRSQAPTPEWTAEFADLIRKGMREKAGRFVFQPEVAIRLFSGEVVTEVLISISQDMAAIHSAGLPSIRGSFEVPHQTYLPVLARAFQKNPEVLDLIRRGPTRSQPPIVSRERNPTVHGPFWQDCVLTAAEGDYVHYDEPPEPVVSPLPEYPPGLKKSDRGRILLHVFVHATGRVCFAKVIQGNPPFEKYVLEAVRRWVFKPAMAGTSPVGVWIELSFDT